MCIPQGKSILEEQKRQIALAMETVFEVDLGGADGQAAGWGRCLGVRAEDMTHLRSRLGNEVAAESARRGLRAIAAVVYSEVRFLCRMFYSRSFCVTPERKTC